MRARRKEDGPPVLKNEQKKKTIENLPPTNQSHATRFVDSRSPASLRVW
jgi:hypothetical protein